MLRSPIFRYFYLPWATGVCLMIAILIAQGFERSSSEELYFAELTPIVVLPGEKARVIRISPRFPGCLNAPAGDKCAEQLLEDYLYGNTSYPASPTNTGTAGLAMVQLDISARGEMQNIRLLRDPGYGRGADALRIIKSMQAENIRWHPATINGRPVNFTIYLKVRYSNFIWGW